MTALWLLPVLTLSLLGLSILHAWRWGDGDPLFFPVAASYALAMEAAQRLFLRYDYADLVPGFLGVPLLVPLGWAGVWYVAGALARWTAGGRAWVLVPILGGLMAVVIVVPLAVLGTGLGWWRWGEPPALVSVEAFSAGFTFLLGYELATRSLDPHPRAGLDREPGERARWVARMGLAGRVRARVRLLFLILTLAPLLFVHAELLYLSRELLACLP